MEVPAEVANCETFADLLQVAMQQLDLNAHSLWVRCREQDEDFVNRQQVWAWTRGEYVPSDRYRPVLFRALGWGAATQLRAQHLIANHARSRRSA